MSNVRIAAITQRLQTQFSPRELEVVDDGHNHIGHAGHQGAGHFTVRITADAFRGKRLIERHRLVYQAVADLMGSEIHALAIDARD